MIARVRRSAIAVAACIWLAPVHTSIASTSNPYGPGVKSCGSFKSDSYKIRVFAEKLTCKKARAIQREYWNGPDSRKTVVNGGSGAYGYILLDKYPGWKCTSGSGGGGCKKKKSHAYHQNGPSA